MKILITGATGMVGHNLLAVSDFVAKYDLLTPSSKELNLLDQVAVNNYFSQHKPDMVIHLAAKVGGIQANINEPVEFYFQNSLMNNFVIMAACTSGVSCFLNMGSSCMYPKDREVLAEEDLLTGKLEPTNEGYAIAKVSAALLCEYISRQFGYHYKTLIPCNLYGPHDNFDPVQSHMIPAAIRKIHEAKENQLEAVSIWGDGLARREFMYVGDLVNFIIFAVEQIKELPGMINVGLGHDFTINEYYHEVAKCLGYSGEFTHDLGKPLGMRRKRLNIDKVTKLGWQAQTSLEKGINQTYQYYLSLA